MTFFEPLSTTIDMATKGFFVTVVLGTVTVGLLWGLGSHLVWPNSLPIWWHVFAALVTAIVGTGLAFIFAIKFRQRLILDESFIEIGGALRRLRMNYDQIRLVRVTYPDRTMLDRRIVVLERYRGTRRSLTLSTPDAFECFQALRTLAPHTVAIDERGLASLPEDPTQHSAGQEIICEERTRSARKYLTSAFLFCGVSAFCAWHIAAGSASFKMILFSPIGPIAAIFFFTRFFKMQRANRSDRLTQ